MARPQPRRKTGWLAGCVALCALPTVAHATNFLLVIADDLGADKVRGFSDYSSGDLGGRFLPHTPTLGDLAASGLAFTHAWANPLCSPTRASLYTGNFPHRHGVGEPVNTMEQTALNEGTETIASALVAGGYETGMFGKWHLGFAGGAGSMDWTTVMDCSLGSDTRGEDPNPLLFGFDTFEGLLGGDPESYTGWTRVTGLGDGTTSYCLDTTDYPDEFYADAAVNWINARTGPFFAVLSLDAPHTDGDGTHLAREWADLSVTCQSTVAAGDRCVASGNCGDADLDGVDDAQDLLYQYQVECMDTTIGEALAALDPVVLADTVLIFLGDNGTPGNTAGVFNNEEDPYTRSVSSLTGLPLYGKGSAYESGVRVPFLVTDGASYLERVSGMPISPGLVFAPGRVVTRPIEVEDVFNTVLDLAGLPAESVDGGDFADCLREVSPLCAEAGLADRNMYAESFLGDSIGVLAVARAVLRGPEFRLVMEYDLAGGCVHPSLYGVGDSFDEYDRYEIAQRVAIRQLKETVNEMEVSWMPRTSRDTVAWCR